MTTASCWLVSENVSEVEEPELAEAAPGGQGRDDAESGQTELAIALVGAIGPERRFENHLGLLLVAFEKDPLLGHGAADAGDHPILIDDSDVLGVEEDLGPGE